MSLNVPGLYLFKDFFDPKTCHSIFESSLSIHERLTKIKNSPNSAETAETAKIPQPNFVKSEYHNLSSEEMFLRVSIEESDGKELNSEYFPRYGEDGHALAYFRGTENLPHFIQSLIPDIKTLVASNDIITKNVKDSWRLTMNFYKNVSGVVSGFPFHVDIPANGVITMIMNIYREATFQITDGNEIVDMHLPVGALLILSGDSRYKWKHRVLPSESTSDIEGQIERVSLVLGVK